MPDTARRLDSAIQIQWVKSEKRAEMVFFLPLWNLNCAFSPVEHDANTSPLGREAVFLNQRTLMWLPFILRLWDLQARRAAG